MLRVSRMSRWTVVAAVLTVALVATGCATNNATLTGACGEPVDVCSPCGPKPPPPCERPPEANPGEAWCQVWVPPEYGTQMDTICVKPACTNEVFVPPRYGTRPKLVCVAEPEMREKIVPAVWGVKKMERMVCPPKDEWTRIDCPPGELGPCETQCECWTKTTRPAVYECEPCPVCLAPERRCVTYRPAEYKIIEERFMIEAGHCETIQIPAVFKRCFKEICVKPGYWEWRRNTACEVDAPILLTAIQVEMEDNAASGEPAGIFGVGDVVRYDLRVVSDEGSKPLVGLMVVFTLPPELEFISGAGDGIDITGGGQAAQTGAFDLPIGTQKGMHVLCRVTAVPDTNLAQLSASVRDADGNELAVETESTTLKPAP